jgi:hypothetical protein
MDGYIAQHGPVIDAILRGELCAIRPIHHPILVVHQA